jgi:hypothetical protein
VSDLKDRDALSGGRPLPPMRGLQIEQWLLRLRMHPSAEKATTWKDENILSVCVDNGKLQIAIKGYDTDRLPFADWMLTSQ